MAVGDPPDERTAGEAANAQAEPAEDGPRQRRHHVLLVVGAVVGTLVLLATLFVARPTPPLAVAEGLPALPGAPAGPVTQRWVRPIERPVHDLVLVEDLVLLVEFAPVSQGLPAGAHVTALDVADGGERWERRVPARSLVAVVDGGEVQALVDVATPLGPALTVRGVSLDDGGEAWVRPADGARQIAWGPPGLVVTTGRSCRAVRARTGAEVASVAAVDDACARVEEAPRVVSVEVGEDTWVLDADPATTDGSVVRGLHVRSPDGRLVASRRVEDVVLDDLDDRVLGGQLTTRGVVATTARGSGVTLLAVPSLAAAWTLELPDPVTRLASGVSAVAVVTERGDGRLDLRVLR